MFLHLLIHSRSHLVHLDNNTFSFTSFTLLNILTALATTFLTASGPVILHFYDSSIVNIFECDIKCFFSRLDFRQFSSSNRATFTASSSSKEHVKNIFLLTSSFRTVFIINFSFSGITQRLIGFVKFLKLFNITSFSIRMQFFC